MWLICFYLRALFIMNLLFQVKQLTGTITGMFCDKWGNKSTKNVLNSGRTQSSWFTTTMCWPTWHSMQQFLAAKNTAVVPPPSLFNWSGFLVISYFQDLSHRYKGDISRMSVKFKKNCWPYYTPFQEVSSALPAVTEMLDPWHKLTLRLLWMEQWPTKKVN